MIHISRKEGIVLALALYFIIIAAITSFGIYAYSSYIVEQVKINKSSFTRGYYYAIAGGRYMYVLLGDPLNKLKGPTPGPAAPYVTSGGITTLPHDGETVTLTITPGSALGTDLKLNSNELITILIEEWKTGSAWTDGNYRVTTTYRS